MYVKTFAGAVFGINATIITVEADVSTGINFIFSRYIEALGNNGDILLAISTSGNSQNIIKAVEVAKEKGILVITLSGNTGGSLKSLSDICITVPHSEFSDRIQEVHIKIIHSLIHFIESNL